MSQSDDQLPDDLRDDLGALYRQVVPGDERRDQQIVAEALRRLRQGRRRRWLLRASGGAAAVAAAIVVIVTLHRTPPPNAAPQWALGDPPPASQVDILTAFRLSKALKMGLHPSPAWDRNGDGVVDQEDVKAWARLAVQIDRGARP